MNTFASDSDHTEANDCNTELKQGYHDAPTPAADSDHTEVDHPTLNEIDNYPDSPHH